MNDIEFINNDNYYLENAATMKLIDLILEGIEKINS